jgi:hypothetical protein
MKSGTPAGYRRSRPNGYNAKRRLIAATKNRHTPPWSKRALPARQALTLSLDTQSLPPVVSAILMATMLGGVMFTRKKKP